MEVPNIMVVLGNSYKTFTPLLSVGVFTEATQDPHPAAVAIMRDNYGLNIAALWGESFSGKLGERLVLTPVPVHGGDAPVRILLFGLGSAKDVTAERCRRAGGYVGQYAKEHKITEISLDLGFGLDDWACAEGIALALYEYKHKNKNTPAPTIQLFRPEGYQQCAEETLPVSALIRAKYLARDLGNTPANLLTPSVFAKKAEALALSLGIEHEVQGLSWIKDMEMGLLLGVARGSKEDPRFFHAWYTPKGVESPPKVVLVGKGVTFDAGGISLKPGAKMDEMKYDMCGGAAVIASMITVAEMKPNYEVHFVVSMTENLPDGNATKPGDVLTAMDGQTVEILNTDAEGRLILADALCYVKKHIKPDGPDDVVLTFATLTGAVITALGHYKTGVYCSDDEMVREIFGTEAISGEALWRMPLVEEMEDELKSDFADMANIGNSQTGGSIMGALFLKKFIGENWHWAHFDIAGTAWLKGKSALSYQPPGATGVMVGMLAAAFKDIQ